MSFFSTKTKKQTDVKKKNNNNHNQSKNTSTSPSAITCIDFIKVTQKVQLVASDHSFRVEGDQVGGNSICRKQLTTAN